MCPANMLCIVTLGSASDVLTLKCCGNKYASQLHISGHLVYQSCTGRGQEGGHIVANIQADWQQALYESVDLVSKMDIHAPHLYIL